MIRGPTIELGRAFGTASGLEPRARRCASRGESAIADHEATIGNRRSKPISESAIGNRKSKIANRKFNTRAFTLIELLLAITIFSIVLVAMNMVFYTALHLRNKTAQAFDEALPLQRALALMKRDIANIVVPGGILSGTLQSTLNNMPQTTTSSGGSSGSSSSQLLASEGSALTMIPIPGAIESSPFFFTSSGTINGAQPWGDIQQVSYVLMQPTNQVLGRSLVRCVTRNLLPVANPDPPEQEWLLNGVQNLNFLYFDGLQWQPYWDTTQMTNTLPLAIKVQILMTPQPGQQANPGPIELVVPVDVQGLTNQTSQATSSGGTQ